MARRPFAVHRTIVVVDVQGFTDARRSNPQQAAVRRGMYRALEEAFARSGIPWAECQREDRGDGVLVLVSAEVPKARFAVELPRELAAALAEHNGGRPAGEQFRLRMALHAGEVAHDEHGAAGESLNLAFRLVDATPLKAAMANSPGALALIVSSWFYGDVVRHTAGGDPGMYRYVRATVKQTIVEGWIALPDHPDPPGGVTGSPYRGLTAFEEQDTALFFGRDTAAVEVLERMSRRWRDGGLVVVSGVSGAGKSSLLNAGVLARVRRAGLAGAPQAALWPRVVFNPGGEPLDELALAVAPLAGTDAATVRRGLDADPAGFALTARQAAAMQLPAEAIGLRGATAGQRGKLGRLLVMVDQFEQLFTQCSDERQRRAFITALHAAAHGRHGMDAAALVVVCVRADFEARCAAYPQLTAAIQDRYLLGAMTGRQLRLAITEPAKKAGSAVDADLVDHLLAHVRARQPGDYGTGVLPLLSHALDQAWRGRAGRALTLADYDRAGGVEGAVAASAQRAYDGLTPAQRAAARQIFIRLTVTSSDGTDTADRVVTTDLTDGTTGAQARDVRAVLEAFAAERLLTLAAGTVEISHEVLLMAWPLLRDTWLAETHADRIVCTRLRKAAAEWAAHARDPSYLYGGSLLHTAAAAVARVAAEPGRQAPLAGAERDFLGASQRAQQRKTRRKQALTAVLTALAVALAATAAAAVNASRQAARQRDIAIAGRLDSQSEQLADTDPAVSKLLSIAAWRIHPSIDTRYAMLAAAARPSIAVKTLAGQTSPVSVAAFSPGGTTLATGSDDGTVRLWDLATGRPTGPPMTGHTGPVSALAFSPGGTTLATSDSGGRAFAVFGASGGYKALSPRGGDSSVRLWDLASGRQIRSIVTGQPGNRSLAFSPDGTTLATGSSFRDSSVRLWDVASGRRTGSIVIGHASGLRGIGSLAFSPDGTTLATASYGGAVRLWDVAAARHRAGHPLTAANSAGARAVYAVVFAPSGTTVAFSPDGKTVATASLDGTVQLWHVATGHPARHRLTDRRSVQHRRVSSVAFSPDGTTLATGSRDGTVRLWDAATGHLTGDPLAGNSGVDAVAFSPDGDKLAAVSGATVRRWDLAASRRIGKPLTGIADITSAAFSPDSATLATGSYDGMVRLWDVATGHLVVRSLTRRSYPVVAVAYSPDGNTLATWTSDGTVRRLDLETGRRTAHHVARNVGHITAVALSPDGSTLATGMPDGTVRLWDAATGRPAGHVGTGHTGVVDEVALSPDGSTLATGMSDGTVRLWDVAAGRQIGRPLTSGTADPVASAAFSPDGKSLAVGSSYDGTVRLWDVASGRQIGTPLMGRNVGFVASVAFSPDGKTLASLGPSSPAWLWDVANLTDVVPYLCASAGKGLTRAEWARYIPSGSPYQTTCP